ncbi:MAG: hypothetical protein QHD01_16870 [Bradyrhizobium sp.]|uniref:hypothetical protein n=1 Tax=Bradyrhizobium sp. TaxID=376 RepID=UPI0029B4B9C9|nr:hypothetical protein [Bradyrhizobium sp.]MDX3968258.1 hypothetical protein [Bradyrhizobium sp.]
MMHMRYAYDLMQSQQARFVMVKRASLQSEKVEAFKRSLGERRRGEPWYVVALCLEEMASQATAIGYGEDVIKTLAEEATGLSRGVLNRYLSTIRRLKGAAAAAGEPVQSLLSPGFNAVETGVRLYDRSPADGLKMLKELATGRIGLLAARKTSDDLAPDDRDARSRTLRRRGLELQSVQQALERHFPKDSIVQRRPRMRCFRHAGWEVRRSDGAMLCGIDAVTSTGDETSFEIEIEGLLPSAALLSTYFPQFFLAVSPGVHLDATQELIELLETFGLSRVGLLRIGSDLSVEVLRRPQGSPVPDRTSRYESLRTGLRTSQRPLR